MITKKDKILFAGGTALIVLLVVFGIIFSPRASEDNDGSTFQQPTTPVFSGRVLFVEPLQEQGDISVAPAPNIVLSESATGKDVQLIANPKVNFSSNINSNGEKVSFSPKNNLKSNTSYTFQIMVDGEPIFSWNVTTGSKITNQSNLAVVVNKIRSKLPLNMNSFRISYDGATDRFNVFITLPPVEETKQKANKWLKDQGLEDFEALNINYNVTGSLFR